MKYLITFILLLSLTSCGFNDPPIESMNPEITITPSIEPTIMPTEKPDNWWIEELNEENIIGTWQSSPGVGSSFTELFIFRNDQTFIFYHRGINNTERELSYWGTWTFEGNMIILQKEYSKGFEGGKLIEDIISGFTYEGAEIVTRKIEPAQIIEINLSEFVDQATEGYIIENESIIYPSIFMNEVQYWRLSREDYEELGYMD